MTGGGSGPRRRTRAAVAVVVALGALSLDVAIAQTTTGTIAGRVTDEQRLPIATAIVRVESANLQGARSTTTSPTGDYVLPLLPPGGYTLTAESSGLQPRRITVSIAPGRTASVDLVLAVAPIVERIEVQRTSTDIFTGTSQVATTFDQNTIALLPTDRTLNAALFLAPGVHPTGPFQAPSIAGAMSVDSTYLVDGAIVNETIRGQPLPLYIEDAIQETTVFTAGISAEYGRLGGGAVNLITKSGGNRFSGSFRDTLLNDRWRALTPYSGDTRTNNVIPTPEWTLGGPVMRDRLWFFTAGRSTRSDQGRTALTVPYTLSDSVQRYEGKVTVAITPQHSFNTTYTAIQQHTKNISFSSAIDDRSLYNREVPQRLFAATYNGVLSPHLALEGRVSSRRLAIEHDGAQTTDPIEGTLLIDRSRNRRYWSPTFCGICDSDTRNNADVFVKASYFASARRSGSHQVVGGYDGFNDIRRYNNHQSGSDYRILGTSAIIQGPTVYPVWFNDGSTIIQYNPIERDSQGTDFRTHSLFVHDTWRLDRHLTLNVGVRWDKNHDVDSADQLVTTDAAFSPRLGVAWDPRGDGVWTVRGSASTYVSAIANIIADASSPAGRSSTYQWEYRGPAINTIPGAPLVTSDAALRQLFAWFTANGGANLPLVGADIPGVATKIDPSLRSPRVQELVGGVSRTLGSRGALRVDVAHKSFHDFYVDRVDTTTGVVRDRLGRSFDLNVIANDDRLERQYDGMTVSGTYRAARWLEGSGNYTLSRVRGNVDGEDTNGPAWSTAFAYPEYKQASWSNPEGDLAVDQRHRASAWAVYQVHGVRGLTLTAVERISGGVPYSAVGFVDARPYVTNPGYATPQGSSSQRYYYTARDAFRSETSYRTDASLTYTRPLTVSGQRINLFGQMLVLNVFNTFAIVNPASIDTSVLDPVVAGSRFQRFNPFTTTPVEGVNWAKSPTFGQPFAVTAYNVARGFAFSFGVKF